MEDPLELIADILVIVSGLVLLIVSFIFLNLYRRYNKRNHFLIGIGLLAAAIQINVDELDFFFPEDWNSFIPNLIAGIFSLIIALIILTILFFPDRIPMKFEDYLETIAEEE